MAKAGKIYATFVVEYKYASNLIAFSPYRRCIDEASRVLACGCGIAPITYSAIKYGRFRSEFYIADIPTYTFHFAKFRLCDPLEALDIISNNLQKKGIMIFYFEMSGGRGLNRHEPIDDG